MSALFDSLLHRLTWDDLDVAYLRRLVEMARDEDLGGLGLRRRPAQSGDFSTGSIASAPRTSTAHLVARGDLTVCGLPLLSLILATYHDGQTARATVQPRTRDGARVHVAGANEFRRLVEIPSVARRLRASSATRQAENQLVDAG